MANRYIGHNSIIEARPDLYAVQASKASGQPVRTIRLVSYKYGESAMSAALKRVNRLDGNHAPYVITASPRVVSQ